MNQRLSEIPRELTDPHGDDLFYAVDVSETLPESRSKKGRFSTLKAWLGQFFLSKDEPGDVSLTAHGTEYLSVGEEYAYLQKDGPLGYGLLRVRSDAQNAVADATASFTGGTHHSESGFSNVASEGQAFAHNTAIVSSPQSGGVGSAGTSSLAHVDPAQAYASMFLEYLDNGATVRKELKLTREGLFMDSLSLTGTNTTPPPTQGGASTGVIFDAKVDWYGYDSSIVTPTITPLVNGVERTVAGTTISFTKPGAGQHRYVALVLNFADPAAPYYQLVEGAVAGTDTQAATPSLNENTQKYISYVYVTSAGTTATSSVVDATVTQTGQNAVKGSGIWSFVLGSWTALNTTAKTFIGAINELKTGQDGKAEKNILPNTQTASYTLALTDVNKLVNMESAAACTVTIPPDFIADFPIGTMIAIDWGDSIGQPTIAAGGGVTVQSEGNKYKISAKFNGIIAHKLAANKWRIKGALVA